MSIDMAETDGTKTRLQLCVATIHRKHPRHRTTYRCHVKILFDVNFPMRRRIAVHCLRLGLKVLLFRT